MRNKSCCYPWGRLQAISWNELIPRWTVIAAACVAVSFVVPCAAMGGDAPSWMHALVSASVPEHDEKTDAVLLYSEEILTVKPDGKMKQLTRRAYKILRTSGKEYGIVAEDYDSETKISSIHGW